MAWEAVWCWVVCIQTTHQQLPSAAAEKSARISKVSVVTQQRSGPGKGQGMPKESSSDIFHGLNKPNWDGSIGAKIFRKTRPKSSMTRQSTTWVSQRVAINSYRCVDLFRGETSIVAGNLMILNFLGQVWTQEIQQEQSQITKFHAFNGPGLGDAEEDPVRRSQRLQGRKPEVQEEQLDTLFI